MSRSSFALAGEIVGAYRMEIAAALDAMPVRVYLPDDNNEVNLDAEDFSLSIYPWEPEGGDYFLMLGNIDLGEAATRDLMHAFIRALETRSIAARVELDSEDDVDIYETAMWNPGAPERVRGPAKPGLVLGLPLRSGAGGEVRVGTLGDQPVLITLTMHHDAPYTQLADELRLAFDGIAPLESIGPAEGSYGGDMMIERLPAGNPATDVARLSVPSLAQLGAAIADVLARVHAAKTVIAGVQPQLIYVDDDGRFTGLVPRGPRFIYSAPAPSGLRSYPVPYIGYEELGGQPPSPAGDVFALCASLFELGSGTHPFGGDPSDLRPLLARMAADQREPWPAGGALTEVLARGLAQRPDERPTAAVLAGELALLASGARHPRKVA